MTQTIVFSTNRSDKNAIRFLSNQSRYPFVLEGKRWPTVEHYFQAHKFEGTDFEEEIRLAPTVFQAKNMATRGKDVWELDPRAERQVKVKGYGKDQQYRIRENWESVKKDILKKGIYTKFNQKKHLQKKLLETGDATLVDRTSPLTGPILQELRWELSMVDLSDTELTGVNRKVIYAMLYISFKIMKMEGWDVIYPEMVEDGIYVLSPRIVIAKAIINTYHNYSKKLKVSQMRNYQKMMKSIQEYIDTKKFPTQPSDRITSLLTAVIAWVNIKASDNDRELFLGQLETFRGLSITLRPGKRWYRSQVPPKFKK